MKGDQGEMLFRGVLIGLSLLLTVTAASKLIDAPAILGSNGLLASSLRLSIAVGFEFFAAAVIAFATPRGAHRFALLVFFSLACIAGWAWWTKTDCGCFGARTPKSVPLIVDVVAVGVLLGCGRNVAELGAGENAASRRQLLRSVGIGVAIGLFAGGATSWRIEQTSSEVEIPAWFGDNLVGMQFPLLHDDKFAAVIPEMGDVLMVLLRPDCEHCREVAAGWAARGTEQPQNVQMIGISMADGRWTVMPNEVSATPMGSDDHFAISWEKVEEPFVAAPAFIAVRERVVTGVATGDNASELLGKDDWIQSLFGAANE